MFAPTLSPHLWPRTASWSQTWRVKVWHIRGIPGFGTVAGQVCPTWDAPITQVISHSQHRSRREVHVKQKQHHKQCATLAESWQVLTLVKAAGERRGEGDRRYCMSGLDPTSNRGSLNRSKREVTSGSSVRKVILVAAEMMAFEKLREKKGTEPPPGRQLRGHCNHPSKKLRKAQFNIRNSGYWSCHSKSVSL